MECRQKNQQLSVHINPEATSPHISVTVHVRNSKQLVLTIECIYNLLHVSQF